MLSAGTKLGPYEIVAPLGAGGMGEVYRARDLKLGRDVAVKILPDAFASDPDRLARFQREARVLASLNHPNIGGIYGLEEANGVTALVMELVEGEDLSQRLARGSILLDEALPIAKQIAEALEAAHEQGITHRDLKPANIKVRPDGMVKVLDFGLAKAMEPPASSPNVSQSPTITTPAMTQAGMILGTAAYMSPEQAKGRPADKRSDIWAFGAVLFEMLSGQRAFKGEDIADTLAAVLRQDVDRTALPAPTPASVRRLIARCLDRDVRRRLRDMGEARIVLDDPAVLAPTDPTGEAAVAPREPVRPLWRRAIPAALSAIVVGVLASAATAYLRPSPAPFVVTRFPFTLGEGQAFPSGTRQFIAISPDGTQIAYVAYSGGRTGLYLRSMAAPETRPIASADPGNAVLSPVFSPDSNWVAFWSGADQALKKVAVRGGAAVPICPAADQPFGMSWDTAGIVFGQGKGIMRVSANGGTPDVIVTLKEGEQAYGPQMLPGGETVLFTLATGIAVDRWDHAQIVAQSLRSVERKTLVDGGSDARYLPTGHLVYARGAVVFAVPMDIRRLVVTGGAVPMVEGVRRAAVQDATGAAQFSVSSTGSLIYVAGPLSTAMVQSDLALIDRKGGVEPLKLPPGPYQYPRASPSGRQIAVGTDDGKEANVWVDDLGGTTTLRRLTYGGMNRFPTWSADGQRVAFQSDRGGDLGIFWQRADGSGPTERLTTPDQGASHVPESWSTSGDLLFGVTKGSSVTLWAFSTRDKKVAQVANVESRNPINAAFSPDGRSVAYAVTEGAANRIYVEPVPATGTRVQVSTTTAIHPVWSRDGGELVSQPQGGVWAVQTITTRPSFASGAPVLMSRGGAIVSGPDLRRNYDTTPDGRILGVVVAGQLQSAGSTAPQIQVVLNWFEELKARVPVP